jgi:hypothetical protein
MVDSRPLAHTLEHLQKLFNATKSPALANEISARQAGIHFVPVNTGVVNLFRYAAEIGTNDCVWVGRRSIHYSDDIPDWALDNINTLKKAGFNYFTIHSNEPFEVNSVYHSPKLLDPVVLAWKNTVEIKYTSNGITVSDSAPPVLAAIWNEVGTNLWGTKCV